MPEIILESSMKFYPTVNEWDVSGGGSVMRQVMSTESRVIVMELEKEMRRGSMARLKAVVSSSKGFGRWISNEHRKEQSRCPERKKMAGCL